MIGILLFLQVNSWNQSRLERSDENNILEKPYDEFLENKNEVNKSTAIFKRTMNANIFLINLVGSDVWESHTVLLKEREQTLSHWINNQLTPFISYYVAFKEIDYNGNMSWGGKSKLKPDYYTLFKQVKYENILDNVL